LNAGASNVFLFDYSGSIFATERSSTGASSSYQSLASLPALPYWLKLVRSGNVFTLSGASDGVNWVQLESQTVSMAQNVYIGLAVSNRPTAEATAAIDRGCGRGGGGAGTGDQWCFCDHRFDWQPSGDFRFGFWDLAGGQRGAAERCGRDDQHVEQHVGEHHHSDGCDVGALAGIGGTEHE